MSAKEGRSSAAGKPNVHPRYFFLLLLMLLSFCSLGQPPELNFYGSGNLQKSLDNGEKIPASTGLGVNWNYWFPEGQTGVLKLFGKLEFDAMINVAATVDTLRATYSTTNQVTNSSTFGASILTPLNSGQAVKLALRMNFREPVLLKTFIDGVKVKYIGSNRNWLIDDSGSPKVILGTNNYFRLGVFQEFLTKDLLDRYSINLGAYFAYNSIQGDVGQKSNDQMRTQVLGTPNKNFYGPEVALEIRLKNLRAEFGYSWLGSSNEIPGLTGGRLLTTISFVGGFGLKLN